VGLYGEQPEPATNEPDRDCVVPDQSQRIGNREFAIKTTSFVAGSLAKLLFRWRLRLVGDDTVALRPLAISELLSYHL